MIVIQEHVGLRVNLLQIRLDEVAQVGPLARREPAGFGIREFVNIQTIWIG